MVKTNYLNNRIAIVLGLIVMLLAGSVKYTFATDQIPKSMPDLQQETSTLTIETSYTDKDVKTMINGMELTIYKVADLTVKGGDPRYTLTENFSEVEVNFDGMTAKESHEAAKKFAEIVKTKALEGDAKAVSANGYASFGEVPNGMYLVMQTGATGDALKYSAIEPFLIMAPQPTVATDENTEVVWNHNVESLPKVVLGTYQPPPPPEEETVKDEYEDEEKDKDTEKVKGADTGDNIYTLVGSMVLFAAACLIVAFMIKRRRQND